MSPDQLTGWALLHSPLPDEALSPLPRQVYGASNLSDVNEAYVLERLFQCGLPWELSTPAFDVQGSTVMCTLALVIEGRAFHGVGGHTAKRLDVAYKGAYTQAFKNAAKWAGLTLSVYKGGKAKDDVQAAAVEKLGTCPVCEKGDVVPTRSGDKVICSTRRYDRDKKAWTGCTFAQARSEWDAGAADDVSDKELEDLPF